MKYILLLHTLIEIVGGLALIFNQKALMLSDSLTLPTAAVIKLFGTVVFAFGLMGLLVYRKFNYTHWDKLAVMLFMGYHFIQALQCYGMYKQGLLANTGAFILHMAVALLFMGAFMNEKEKFADQ